MPSDKDRKAGEGYVPRAPDFSQHHRALGFALSYARPKTANLAEAFKHLGDLGTELSRRAERKEIEGYRQRAEARDIESHRERMEAMARQEEAYNQAQQQRQADIQIRRQIVGELFGAPEGPAAQGPAQLVPPKVGMGPPQLQAPEPGPGAVQQPPAELGLASPSAFQDYVETFSPAAVEMRRAKQLQADETARTAVLNRQLKEFQLQNAPVEQATSVEKYQQEVMETKQLARELHASSPEGIREKLRNTGKGLASAFSFTQTPQADSIIRDLQGLDKSDRAQTRGRIFTKILTDERFMMPVIEGKWDQGVKFTHGDGRQVYSLSGPMMEALEPLSMQIDVPGGLKLRLPDGREATFQPSGSSTVQLDRMEAMELGMRGTAGQGTFTIDEILGPHASLAKRIGFSRALNLPISDIDKRAFSNLDAMGGKKVEYGANIWEQRIREGTITSAKGQQQFKNWVKTGDIRQSKMVWDDPSTNLGTPSLYEGVTEKWDPSMVKQAMKDIHNALKNRDDVRSLVMHGSELLKTTDLTQREKDAILFESIKDWLLPGADGYSLGMRHLQSTRGDLDAAIAQHLKSILEKRAKREAETGPEVSFRRLEESGEIPKAAPRTSVESSEPLLDFVVKQAVNPDVVDSYSGVVPGAPGSYGAEVFAGSGDAQATWNQSKLPIPFTWPVGGEMDEEHLAAQYGIAKMIQVLSAANAPDGSVIDPYVAFYQYIKKNPFDGDKTGDERTRLNSRSKILGEIVKDQAMKEANPKAWPLLAALAKLYVPPEPNNVLSGGMPPAWLDDLHQRSGGLPGASMGPIPQIPQDSSSVDASGWVKGAKKKSSETKPEPKGASEKWSPAPWQVF